MGGTGRFLGSGGRGPSYRRARSGGGIPGAPAPPGGPARRAVGRHGHLDQTEATEKLTLRCVAGDAGDIPRPSGRDRRRPAQRSVRGEAVRAGGRRRAGGAEVGARVSPWRSNSASAWSRRTCAWPGLPGSAVRSSSSPAHPRATVDAPRDGRSERPGAVTTSRCRCHHPACSTAGGRRNRSAPRGPRPTGERGKLAPVHDPVDELGPTRRHRRHVLLDRVAGDVAVPTTATARAVANGSSWRRSPRSPRSTAPSSPPWRCWRPARGASPRRSRSRPPGG